MSPLERIARTIAGLYNHAKPLLGADVNRKMSIWDAGMLALAVLEEGELYIDYCARRVLKVRINASGDVVGGVGAYERENGVRAATAILAGLGDPDYAIDWEAVVEDL